ncbi:GDP-mannose 4,6 dehydratase 2-like [Rhodamnia argentea]|uniref:GDP-mannose 4,6-dehydratase n=1 Tax=Rhodamnia argentea TaxID=178133 RepID=A0A8B8P8W8_9MYRT|nr:GDP-mannose 4,6 dehydratase 2-like [Rhodamnia argentea]
MATQNDTPKSGSGTKGEAPPPQYSKVALIIGIAGQVGSYLSEFLLDKGYEVYGMSVRSSNFNTQRVDHIYINPRNNAHNVRMKLRCSILTDSSLCLRRWIDAISPDEVYNLADQYEVAVSLETPEYPDIVATVAFRLLEAVRSHVSVTGRSHIRYFQSGSSEVFGPQSDKSGYLRMNEKSQFHPWSLYGVSKCAAHWYTVYYREAHGLFACNGILFNPESPRQDWNFVTRKITRAVGRIKMGLQSKLFLGNLLASRDWGFAGDYMEAMWMMLQQGKPDDYVVGMGESHTVDEIMMTAFEYVGLEWRDYVVYDNEIPLRPAGVDQLRGDATKAKEVLGWKAKVGFEKLVEMMVDEDIELAKREKVLVDTGYIDVCNSRVLGHFEEVRSQILCRYPAPSFSDAEKELQAEESR